MSVTYDGRLVLHPAAAGRKAAVGACCGPMTEALCLDAVKIGTQAKRTILKIAVAHKWSVINYCPFCGAEAFDTEEHR